MLDAIEAAAGPSPKLVMYTGAEPANNAAAATGTVLVTITLPSDWMANAANGLKSLAGVWTGVASAAGNAGYFRIWDSTQATCHVQGTVTATGGGGDLTVDNISIANNQTVAVTQFDITAANA